VREPLILPLVFVALGVLTGRLFGFSVHESAWPIAAFLILALAARSAAAPKESPSAAPGGSPSTAPGSPAAAPGNAFSRFLPRACIALALFFTGVFAEAWHRPGPPPEIDVGSAAVNSRETVILAGCVVEPAVFSNDREQFTLELDSSDPGIKARARVTLALDPDAASGAAASSLGSAGESALGSGTFKPAGDTSTPAGDTSTPAADTLTPASGLAPQRLDYGQHVEIEARVRRPHNFNNPGSFDYAAYLARRHIFWTATMPRGSTVRVLPGRCGWRFMSAVFGLRTAAVRRIERLYGQDNYSSGMMEATLIGETSKLEKIWTDNFRRTGTFHALVISGLHVMVLAAVLLFLLRLCALPEMPALAFTVAAAWLYALVSGFSAPVVRAAGGFTLYAVARFFFRRGRVLNLLAAIALVFILWDPGQLFDASFQLSILCVAAIGALARPLLESTSAPLARGVHAMANVDMDPHLEPRSAQFRVEMRLIAETIALWIRLPLRWSIELVSLAARVALFAFQMALISAVVQIGLALPMAVYFHRVSLSGLTANMLIVPLLSGVVPLGFISIFTGWRWVAQIAAWMLRLSASIADWHARLEPNWRIADPPVWLAMACLGALIAMAMALRARAAGTSLHRGTAGENAANHRASTGEDAVITGRRRRNSVGWRWSTAGPALAAVLATFTLLVWHPFPPAIALKTLELTAIDVGQGDSLLVTFPDGRAMVVDGGGVLQFGIPGRVRRKPTLDIGEDVVSPYLWSRGIRRIDVLVVTHAHEDHSGGAGALIANFRPREVWVGANPLAGVLETAARFHIPVIAKRVSEPFAYGGATIQILSPPSGYVPTKNMNNDSLAFRISYGVDSFLLTGDMERPMETRLLASGLDIQANVLKIGHHGSKTSTTQPFLDAVAPSISIISDGFENSFGHPHRDVLARLAGRGSAVLRTDLDGLVTVRTDGRRLTMDTMLWHGESAWWYGERSFNWTLEQGW
jgi:competence protein ComEC